jgi:hypothetical protein
MLKAELPDAGFRDATQDCVDERIAVPLMAVAQTRSAA